MLNLINLFLCYRNELFTSWLITLPQLLCQPFVSHHVLTTFSCLAKQQNQVFLDNLADHSSSIIGKQKKYR